MSNLAEGRGGLPKTLSVCFDCIKGIYFDCPLAITSSVPLCFTAAQVYLQN